MLELWGIEVLQAWMIVASVILVIELLLLNSYYLLAVAAGAAVSGVLSFSMDISRPMQWLTFALATVLGAWLLRMFRSPEKKEVADDVSYMVGKLVQVQDRVAPRGRVLYKSVSWAAESDVVFEAGETARIGHVNGSTLFIEAIEIAQGER